MSYEEHEEIILARIDAHPEFALYGNLLRRVWRTSSAHAEWFATADIAEIVDWAEQNAARIRYVTFGMYHSEAWLQRYPDVPKPSPSFDDIMALGGILKSAEKAEDAIRRLRDDGWS